MMRSRFLSLLLLLSAGGTTVWGQYSGNGICCDPSSFDFADGATCQALGEDPTLDPDGFICDPDCADYDGEATCTSIPIDGGLGLLALAGSGLAAARMRRRREEEGLAVEHVD